MPGGGGQGIYPCASAGATDRSGAPPIASASTNARFHMGSPPPRQRVKSARVPSRRPHASLTVHGHSDLSAGRLQAIGGASLTVPEASMLHLLRRTERSFLIGCGLGLAAVVGWSSFAYSAWSSRRLAEQDGSLTTERNVVLANHQKLQQATGELKQVEAKLDSAHVEYGRSVEAWAQTRAKLAAAKQELAALTKRGDQARDRVSQTGSPRPADAPKAAARKP